MFLHKTITKIKIINIPIPQKFSHAPLQFIPLPHPQPLEITGLFSYHYRLSLYFLEFYIKGILIMYSFFIWLCLLNVIILRFIHIVTCINSLFFLLLSSIPLYEWITIGFPLTWWGTFGLLPVVFLLWRGCEIHVFVST